MLRWILTCMFLCAPVFEAPAADKGSGKDRVATPKGSLEILPLNHATFAMKWSGRVVYVDPVGGKERFKGIAPPDLVLITDTHGDHLSAPTVQAVLGESTVIVAPRAAAEKLAESGIKGTSVKTLSNGQSINAKGIGIRAIPMYNTTPDRERYHQKGRGNGYVLDLARTRVYISGDTEDIPEMRALKKIDVAFICMNLPFTMKADAAASAVLEFRPKIVYPYHYRGRGPDGTQDPQRFKSLVESKSKKIEVRVRDWYGKK